MSTVQQLDTHRIKWVRENARPAKSPCLCGCETLTRSRFAPGHDATLKQSLRQTVEKGGPAARTARTALQRLGWDE